VAFLTTRVKSPDEDDWGKLKRALRYLNGTKNLKLKLKADNLGILKWYIDGLHNVHWDCRGHLGGLLRIGQGAAIRYSRKMKLNTRSPTKTELLGADMYMPKMLWSLYFIQSQGCMAECIRLYQDNISAQLLMKNGKFSSEKKTKHIKAKNFFIKDRVDKGEIKVMDCSSKEMWADVLTKLLKRMAFRKMRAELMNCEVNYEGHQEEETTRNKSSLTVRGKPTLPSQTSQECVGKNRSNALKWARNKQVGVARIVSRKVTWPVGEEHLEGKE
jgi:hypothetical protein